jgi:hypothetical protein
MQRRRPPDPGARQARNKAILNQATNVTQSADEADRAAADQASPTESVGRADRSMYPPHETTRRFSYEEMFGAISVLAVIVGVIWYFANQAADVRVLQDDTKELKSKAGDAAKFSAETGFRLNSLEQRSMGLEQRVSTLEQRPAPPGAPTTQPAPSR